MGLIPGSGRSPEEGTGKPLQYSSGLQSKVLQTVRKIEQVSKHIKVYNRALNFIPSLVAQLVKNLPAMQETWV